MREWFPRLCAALAVGWGALGLAALVGLLLGGASGLVSLEQAMEGSTVGRPLAVLAFAAMAATIVAGLAEAGIRGGSEGRTALRVLGTVVLVPAAHAVGVFAMLAMLAVLIWSPLFGAVALNVAALFYWAVLSGGSWAGLAGGAVFAASGSEDSAPGRWIAGLAALAAVLGLAGFADGMSARAQLALYRAPFAGTVLVVAFSLGTGWLSMVVGGWLATRSSVPGRRRAGLGVAALGSIWAGGGGCVAYAWALRAIVAPVAPGAGLGGWAPAPAALADGVQVLGILLPTPAIVGALCGVAWLMRVREREPEPPPPHGYTPSDVR